MNATDLLKVSYSEASTLAGCEQRWWYRYGEEIEETPGAALVLGTLLHVGTGEPWLRNGVAELPVDWEDPHSGEMVYLADFPEAEVAKAEWLLDRWNKHYGPPSDDWEIIAVEDSFSFEWNGLLIVVRTDGLIRERSTGHLWLREVKSYGRNTRLELVSVSPQETIYAAGIEAKYGERPFGILFDGIYTYQWVPEKPTQKELIAEAEAHGMTWATKKAATVWAREMVEQHPGVERPPADSFSRLWPDRSEEQIDRALEWLAAVAERKYELTEIRQKPIANVGPLCDSCFFKPRCFQDLLGVESDEIEVELDD